MTQGARAVLRATWILFTLEARVRLNRLAFARARMFTRASSTAAPRRTATPGKRAGWFGAAFAAVAALGFCFQLMLLQNSYLHRLVVAFDDPHHQARHPLDELQRFHRLGWSLHDPQGMVNLVALQLAVVLLLFVGFGLGAGRQDLGRLGAKTLWVISQPIPNAALFVSELASFTVLNVPLVLVTAALMAMACLDGGHGRWSIPLALLASLCLALVVGALRMLIETYVRLRWTVGAVKNLQALGSGLSMVLMVAMYVLLYTPELTPWLVRDLARVPLVAIPGAMAAGFGGPGQLLLPVVVTVASSLGIAGVAIVCCCRLVRGGFERQSGAYAGVRRTGAAALPSAAWSSLGIVRRDLVLLRRDRNLLVSLLVMPVAVLVMQLVVNRSLIQVVLRSFDHLAAFAFGYGAYVLLGTGMYALTLEGQGLWLLFASPMALDRLLLRKSWMYLLLTWSWAGIILLSGASWQHPGWEGCASALMVLLGLAVFSPMTVAIGVLGTDPRAPLQRQFRLGNTYGLVALVGFYGYAIAHHGIHLRLAALVLSGLLAIALWQRMRQRLPFLLDPVTSAPPVLDLSDGMLAGLGFFIVQVFVNGVCAAQDVDPATAVAIAYITAGVVVSVVMGLVLWRRRIPDLTRVLGLRARRGGVQPYLRAVASGLALGLAAAGVGLAYLRWIVPHVSGLAPPAEHLIGGATALALVAIIAAPLTEEFIFRGLILPGLMRTLPVGWAILIDAGLFGLVHPTTAVIPVAVLGIAAAIAVRSSGLLVGGIVAHATYNAVIVLLQT